MPKPILESRAVYTPSILRLIASDIIFAKAKIPAFEST